jgi:glycosyltransferase involved in cell wall biosynthesis
MLSADFLPNIGGITTHVYELSKALMKQGHNVWMITCKSKFRDANREEIEGIKIYRIFLPRVRLIGTMIYCLLVWFRIMRLIKRGNIDILHIHTLNPDAPAARFVGGLPKVETEHSSSFLKDMETGRSLRLNKWLLNSADCVIGPSQELVESFVKLGINPDKTCFISNGVDAEKFHPKVNGREIRGKYGIKPEQLVILCPRRLVTKNGVRYLIEAIPQIIDVNPDTRCLIVGDGDEREMLHRRVVELKIADNVIFTGRIDNSVMPAYYAVSNIVVLPSLIEATSIAGLESMAMGKPLVATNIGGIPQIVDDGETGVLVPPGDPKRLAEGIISLLSDDTRRQIMGVNARKKVEAAFSWDVIAEKILNIYSRLIES